MLARASARPGAGRVGGGGAAPTRRTAPSSSSFSLFSPPSQLSRARPSLKRGRALVTRQQQSEGEYGAVGAATTTTATTPETKTIDAPPVTTPTTPTSRADADAPPAAAPAPAGDDASSGLFDWRRCWYPVALVESLHTDRPNALQLLGEPLVAWKPLGGGDGDNASASSWVVQRDACPHRLAPLSEGRLESDGTVMCSYHGWRFAPSGDLKHVPQLAGADAAAHARACSSGSRGCVAVHPSRVVDGVLWAWAEAGGTEVAARAVAAGPPASLPPEMLPQPADDEGAAAAGADRQQQQPWRANALGWYTRDVPLSAEMIVENFLDASHIPWSHHGVMGDRNAPDHTILMTKSTSPTAPATTAPPTEQTPAEAAAARGGGFSVRVQPPSGRAPYGLSFVPPGLVRYDFGGVAMLLHVTPTSPGRSRIFLTVIEPPPPKKTDPPRPLPLGERFSRLLALLDPRTLKNRWRPLYHATNRNAALDGDALLLYKAQGLLQSGGGAGWGAQGGDGKAAEAAASAPSTTNTTAGGHGVDWRRLYYMPASADLAVTAWRRWLDGPGRAMPMLLAYAAAPPPPLSRLEVFDRYEQHTRHCPHCMRALHVCNLALGFLAMAGLAAFTVAVWFACAAAAGGASAGAGAAGAPLAKAAASVGVSALCAWAASALWRLRMLFIVYDYQHAEH